MITPDNMPAICAESSRDPFPSPETNSMSPENDSYASFAVKASRRKIATTILSHCFFCAKRRESDNASKTNIAISTPESPRQSNTSGLNTSIHNAINREEKTKSDHKRFGDKRNNAQPAIAKAKVSQNQ